MKKVYQTIFTDIEKGIVGNCLQACVASLFEVSLEDVPYFNNMYYYKDFLSKKFRASVDQIRGTPDHDGKHYIAGYKVAKFEGEISHAVIWRNGRIVHDPRRQRVRLYRIMQHYQILIDSSGGDESLLCLPPCSAPQQLQRL